MAEHDWPAERDGRPTCLTCRYFEDVGTDEGPGRTLGVCRRYPPRFVGEHAAGGTGSAAEDAWSFPWLIGESEWCGEHREKD